MTTKSYNLPKSEQKQYVESYKALAKRMNFNGNEYLTIFADAAKQYKAYEKQIEDLFETCKRNGTTSLEWYIQHQEIDIKMKREELIAITFAVMFLECFIWDYAAVNTSQKFAECYLEKINLLGKWKVIPKLVNNDKNINIGQKAITLLKKLVRERNNIVHSKSKLVPNTYAEIKKIEKKACQITITETWECIRECIEGLKKVDTTNYWYFEEEVKHTFKMPIPRTGKKKKGKTLLTS